MMDLPERVLEMMPPLTTDPAAEALELIQRAVHDARNPRLGTDTRLAHALTAITLLSRWARYQDERQRLLAAEVYGLRQGGGTLP